MNQTIDVEKLKAAAEHLEWVLNQYPSEPAVQGMLRGLSPLIEDAKTGRVLLPIADRHDIPFRWAVSAEGLYRDYQDPDVEGAYVAFSIEMEGGLTKQEKRILADMEAQRKAIWDGSKS